MLLPVAFVLFKMVLLLAVVLVTQVVVVAVVWMVLARSPQQRGQAGQPRAP